MKIIFKEWLHKYFAEPEAGILLSTVIFFVLLFMFFNQILAPVFASIVIAYLLDWAVLRLQRVKCPHVIAVVIVFILFITIVILLFLGLLPVLTKQLNNLIVELPRLVIKVQSLLADLPKHFTFINQAQVNNFIELLQSKIGHFGQAVLSRSFSFIPNLVAFIVYLVMVPMLVYFFLMDKSQILHWFGYRFVPRRRAVLGSVWAELHIQIGNYVRGKVLEAFILAIVSIFTFWLLGLQYWLLLGALVGLSVFIPYIGAIVVTVPVLIVAILQWSLTPHFWWVIIAYTIIQALDANVLVPLLFSEAVSLHPVAIIVAVLVFGGIWGFWGIFFAIPLAALAKAIMVNWPVAKLN